MCPAQLGQFPTTAGIVKIQMQEVQKHKGRASTRLVAELMLQDETLQSGDLRRASLGFQPHSRKKIKKKGGGGLTAH